MKDEILRKMAEVTARQRQHRSTLDSIAAHARGWEQTASARAEGTTQVLRESPHRHPAVEVLHRQHVEDQARCHNLIGMVGERQRGRRGG